MSADDPLAPFRAPASPEQRAACLHPSDDRAPLSGDGWLCCLCGADCARPDDAPAELTAERLDDVERMAREAHGRAAKATVGPWTADATQEDTPVVYRPISVAGKDAAEVVFEADWGTAEDAAFAAAAREDVPVLAAAVLALSAEVRRLREENARMRPVVEAAEAWNQDGALTAEVTLSKALASMEPPRAEAQPLTDERWQPGATWERHDERFSLVRTTEATGYAWAWLQGSNGVRPVQMAEMTEARGWRYMAPAKAHP